MEKRRLLIVVLGCLLGMNLFGQDYIISNQVVTTCTGNLSDSGSQESYANNEDLTFVIAPEGANGLTLTFSEWDVEAGYDFLYIYDGADTNAPLLGTFSANLPETITASGGSLTLQFVSDATVTQGGWQASWTSFGRGCGDDTPGSMTYLDSCTGVLYDLGGESANYGNNEDYKIVIAPGAFDVMLTFDTWDVEAGYDFLYIYDGESTDAPLIGTYSETNPGTVTANSGKMTLHFVSDESVSLGGWAATWSGAGGTCSTLLPPPTAGFSTSNAINITVGGAVHFADDSTGNPTDWNWTFEGGSPNTSTNQSPVVTYTTPGTYTVTLTVSNPFGENTMTKTGFITVNDNAVQSFTMNQSVATSCTGIITDSGDLEANYSSAEHNTFVIAPEGAYDLTLTFEEWDVEAGYDYLYIFDGETTEAPLLGSFSETTPGSVTSTSGKLTLLFISDESVTMGGWKANWTSYGRGCMGTANSRILTSAEQIKPRLSVFPNPVVSIAQVSLNVTKEEKVNFSIIDLNGKVVLNEIQTVQGTHAIDIDLSQLDGGAYILKVTSNSIYQTLKIVKAKQ